MDGPFILEFDQGHKSVAAESFQVWGYVTRHTPVPPQIGSYSVSLADTSIQLTGHIKLLGVTLDSNLSLDKHVSTVARSCNYQLWSLRHIRHLLTVDVTAALCRCLILSRLDYNSLLHQLSSAVEDSAQSCSSRDRRRCWTDWCNDIAPLASGPWKN